MTGSPPVSWEALNAYVDGELAPAAAADVAAAIALDPDVAARVASLSRLRATTRNLPQDVSTQGLRLPGRKQAFSVRFAALAASLVVVGGIGAAIWSFSWAPEDGGPLLAAVDAHHAWLADAKPAQDSRLQVAMANASATALPDLAPASLTLVYLSLDPAIRKGGGVLAGYVGPNGCRVGLWIAPHHGPAHPQPVADDRDGLMIRRWSGAGADYALLGRDIDSLRLDRIAALVAKLIRMDPVLPREQIAALDEARSIFPACTG